MLAHPGVAYCDRLQDDEGGEGGAIWNAGTFTVGATAIFTINRGGVSPVDFIGGRQKVLHALDHEVQQQADAVLRKRAEKMQSPYLRRKQKQWEVPAPPQDALI